MSFILGNEEILNAFRMAKRNGKHSHAYIIEGAEGSGKLTLARSIAAALICERGEPCFECPPCRRIMQGVHQDVKEIGCDADSSVIKIDTIRQSVIADAYIKPAECDKKIFIINDAHKTKTETQNALLQIFEEPPRNVIIFLLVPSRNLLLSTLKSRAVTLKTQKLSDEVIKDEILRRYPENAAFVNEALTLADGALGQALDFMDSEENRAAAQITKSFFTTLSGRASFSSLSSILTAGIANDKKILFSVMSCFSTALRDILVCSEGYEGRGMFFADRNIPISIAQKTDKKRLFDAYDTVCRIIRDSVKTNLTLAVADICMTLSDDFYN